MLAVAIRAFQEMRSLEEGHQITDAPVTLVETPVSEAI
jgi:hypothetical protein